MLHCNMKLVWQSSYALIDLRIFQPGGVVNLDCRGCGGERLQRADEIARCGHREMRSSAARSAHCSMNTSRSGFSQSTCTA